MKKEDHAFAARRFLQGSEMLRLQGYERLEGEAIWGAACEAIFVLADHMEKPEHPEYRIIAYQREIIALCVDRGVLTDFSTDTISLAVLPLHEHFYRAGLERSRFIAHAADSRAIIERMLSII